MSNQKGSVVANIVIAIVVVVFLLALWKIGVPFLKNFMLDGDVRMIVNYDRENKVADPSMVRSTWEKVKTQVENRNIPVRDDEIQVDWELDRIIVDINYKWPVNFLGFRFNIPFHIHRESEGPGFAKSI